tara:strand:- start:4327 stop:4617 length:291 start_codon:yes stop_codon:yes gene_type:complete
MNTVNRPIKIEDLQVGDEVIVRGVDLNYMILIRLPKLVSKTRKYSDGTVYNYNELSNAKCTRDNSIWYGSNEPKKDVYFDFAHKSMWLVKRIDINK